MSFDPDNGTGNVLSFGAIPAARQNHKIAVHPKGIRAYGMVPRTRSAHVTRHKEDAVDNGIWGFARAICVVPEVNDPVGVWLPPQCER